jgi:hypothetical protein
VVSKAVSITEETRRHQLRWATVRSFIDNCPEILPDTLRGDTARAYLLGGDNARTWDETKVHLLEALLAVHLFRKTYRAGAEDRLVTVVDEWDKAHHEQFALTIKALVGEIANPKPDAVWPSPTEQDLATVVDALELAEVAGAW